MKYNVVVATHHKTGTVWMDGVFKGIAKDLGVACIDFKAQYSELDELLEKPFILLNTDSEFGKYGSILDRKDVRTLHVIRDPRDVVISAMHYHRHARESWLHEPVHAYDNCTYQHRLNGLPSRTQQYVYEMDHSSNATVKDMLKWQYGRTNCFEARYETLRSDGDLVYWHKVLTFLGFDGSELEIATRRFWQNSLFGGLPRLGNKHIRCGTVAQWRHEFNVPLAYAFVSRFPGALQKLGYEPNHNWIVELQTAKPGVLPSLAHRLLDRPWSPVQYVSGLLSLF
jgi:hypothetical protein